MKISEVSEKYALSADTLRYYERVGLIPPVNRTENGIRDYNDLDLRRVEFVKCMRKAGLPVDVLVDYVRLVQKGDQTAEARREILIEQKERILVKVAELQEVLGILDHKIEVYDQIMLKVEQNLNEVEKE
jgi:DNA-binding transcriptional MerR regulator